MPLSLALTMHLVALGLYGSDLLGRVLHLPAPAKRRVHLPYRHQSAAALRLAPTRLSQLLINL